MPAPHASRQDQQAAFAQKQAQIGPQTSLKDECETHNAPILFQTPDKAFCEKCFAERVKEAHKEQQQAPHRQGNNRNAPQENVPALAGDDLLSRLKEPAKPFQAPDLDAEEPIDDQSEAEGVRALHGRIEALSQSLSQKIEKKHEGLYLNHQHFALYESTLNEKYQPVFQQMKQVIQDKRQEYTHYLSSQLLKNDETVKLEKAALDKLQNAL